MLSYSIIKEIQATLSFSFPTVDGSNGQVLVTDGSGTLSWSAINAASTLIADADNDTKVQVEESSDEDKVRFDVGNEEVMNIDGSATNIYGNLNVGGNLNATSNLSVNTDNGSNSFLVSSTPFPDWQSFKATETGMIDYIEIAYDDLQSATLPGTIVTYTIYEGEGIGGNIVTTFTHLPTFLWNQISIPDGVILQEDVTYTLAFDNKRGIARDLNNNYSDGRAGDASNFDYRLRLFTFLKNEHDVSISGSFSVNDIRVVK